MWWDNLFFHIFTIGGGNNNLLRRMQCSLLLRFVNFGVQQVHSCSAQRGRAHRRALLSFSVSHVLVAHFNLIVVSRPAGY